MITNLFSELKKEAQGVGMNFGGKTEIEIHDSAFYEKIDFIFKNCSEVEELIIEQEEAKVDYVSATDAGTENELIDDIGKLNIGNINLSC